MTENKRKIYLGGDIMSFGSNLARQYEYDKFKEAGIDADIYSPVLNKSINDKSNMTEEENNVLAEKITQQDIDRLWESDIVVMCPEQSAIGTMCEIGCLYGWKYIGSVLKNTADKIYEIIEGNEYGSESEKTQDFFRMLGNSFFALMYQLLDKEVYAHYFDIRTNHLNEKDWRRSFSINQMLYGMILAATEDQQLHNAFDELIPIIKDSVEKAAQAAASEPNENEE